MELPDGRSPTAADHFPAQGSHLERYSSRFDGVEVNSSFYRPHRQSTYARWAETVPDDFRFSVKLPGEATHECRLKGCAEVIRRFSMEVAGLGEKLRVLLVQLPPSLPFEAGHKAFFQMLRDRFDAAIVCEPRHASWFSPDVDKWLSEQSVGRVAADPALGPNADRIGGWSKTAYYRLHGSPRTYYSPYDHEALKDWAEIVTSQASSTDEVWIIFDNTARGAAADNALFFQQIIGAPGGHQAASRALSL